MKIVQPETKRAKPGWLVLLIVLAVLVTSLWFREGDLGPIHRVRSAVQVVATPVSRAGMWVTSPARNFTSWVRDLGVSRSELQELRAQNDDLKTRVATLEERLLQYEQVSQLLATATDANRTGVTATVIGLPQSELSRVVTLDRGAEDGVEVDMPVVGPNGLIGQVTEVGRTWCRVRLITDSTSGVAALIQRTRTEGVTRGSVSGDLTLDFIAPTESVIDGDVVLTSGQGGVYPRGIVVGTVVAVRNNKTALYQSITVEPADDINSVEAVMILTSAAPATTGAGE